jgi:hypothetical protein
MESKKDSNEGVKTIDDRVSFQIKVIEPIKTDIASITGIIDKFQKIKTNITIIIILLLLLCLLPFIYYAAFFAPDRIIYASAGILTFISIFYSLLVSQTGKSVISKTNKLLEKAKEKIEEISIKEMQDKKITKFDDVEEINRIKVNADAKIEELEGMKKFVDVGYYLISTVFFLLISILFSLFNIVSLQIVAFLFFTGGFCISGAIVLLWRSLPQILDILVRQLGEEV